jgi:YidC/Oxa1 family membrane protein insertase
MSLLGSLLQFFYDLIPDYAAAITLLTLTVMVVLLPLTIKGTRSMLAMQRLGPDIRKLQERHKNDRQKLNEEMMALYRDNKINPLGGCLPLLLQLPVFFILYNVIFGMSRMKDGVPAPKYIDHDSHLYRDIVEGGGKLESFGVDLAAAAKDHHASFAAALPFFALILIMVGLQYWQQHQVTSRSIASADTPQAQQMKMIQKFFPPLFGIFSIWFPAGVVLYSAVSSIFRIGQQSAMYRFDPQLKTTVESAKKEAAEFLKSDDQSGRAQKSPGKSSSSKNSSKKKKKKGR